MRFECDSLKTAALQLPQLILRKTQVDITFKILCEFVMLKLKHSSALLYFLRNHFKRTFICIMKILYIYAYILEFLTESLDFLEKKKSKLYMLIILIYKIFVPYFN